MPKSRTPDADAKTNKADSPKFDLTRIGKSKRLAKKNKEYLDLLSVVEKSRRGLEAEQARLKSKPAKESAKQLLRQLDLVFHMTFLPYLILIAMEGRREGFESVFRERFLGIKDTPQQQRKAFEKGAKTTMQHFFALDVSGSLSRPWLAAITVYIWTAFECLAGDLWTNSLNDATRLAQQALTLLSNEDTENVGLSRRHIDVGLAARYGFNLRKTLGTILKPKFDFSSMEGIQSAYKQAFGTCGDLHESAALRQLEQVRHLILHRGGVTDEKFIKLTRMKVRKGKPLPLTLSQVENYMMAVTMGCVGLLKIVDEWFASNQG